MVTVSAPGKIHLMGEHAVVYGKPALLTAIDLRLSVTVKESPTKTHEIHVTDEKARELLLYALSIVKKNYKTLPDQPLDISVSSQIPFGYHLGSSAALAVATIGAVVYCLKQLWNPMEINQLAYEVEKKQHGNPSGGDNTAVTMGGFLWFRKELEFLKSMWQLPFKPAKELNHFFLINTGKPEETTGEMVAQVAEFAKQHPQKMQELLDENELQTKRVTMALKEGTEPDLFDAIHKGEKTLEAMGVVNELIATMIETLEKQGAAAKILGGGGKKGSVGFVLCYHPDPEKIAQLVHPYTIQRINICEEGVRLELRD